MKKLTFRLINITYWGVFLTLSIILILGVLTFNPVGIVPILLLGFFEAICYLLCGEFFFKLIQRPLK